ncbi:MAG: DUF6112 family protein [Sporichthyaceae bacterium]
MSMLAHILAATAVRVPTADVVPPVAPNSAGMPGAAAIQTIMGWSMSLALAACVLGAIGSGAAIGIGHLSSRPHMAERGKVGLIAAIVGAVVAGSAVRLVNTGYGLA